MKTITEVENETGLSYRLLLTLCKENKVAHIKAGRKFLINYEKLIDYLNTGDTEAE
ncbi:MAG: DNA-binding protein [Lachnospiraceae bacterium]|nr:DNA-binding protein [Lachnospiraceae bacterium]